jgi:hypothetical protein
MGVPSEKQERGEHKTTQRKLHFKLLNLKQRFNFFCKFINDKTSF